MIQIIEKTLKKLCSYDQIGGAELTKNPVTPKLRHPERVFLREGSSGSGTYSNNTTFRRSFAQKDALWMAYLGSYV